MSLESPLSNLPCVSLSAAEEEDEVGVGGLCRWTMLGGGGGGGDPR